MALPLHVLPHHAAQILIKNQNNPWPKAITLTLQPISIRTLNNLVTLNNESKMKWKSLSRHDNYSFVIPVYFLIFTTPTHNSASTTAKYKTCILQFVYLFALNRTRVCHKTFSSAIYFTILKINNRVQFTISPHCKIMEVLRFYYSPRIGSWEGWIVS